MGRRLNRCESSSCHTHHAVDSEPDLLLCCPLDAVSLRTTCHSTGFLTMVRAHTRAFAAHVHSSNAQGHSLRRRAHLLRKGKFPGCRPAFFEARGASPGQVAPSSGAGARDSCAVDYLIALCDASGRMDEACLLATGGPKRTMLSSTRGLCEPRFKLVQ